MKHPKHSRLTLTLSRPTTAEQRACAKRAIRVDCLPAMFSADTYEGGTLKFSQEDGQITFIHSHTGDAAFGMHFATHRFLSLLRDGGSSYCPSAGLLMFEPDTDGWVRLRFVPERETSGSRGGVPFTAEFSIGELIFGLCSAQS